jgi:RHS repeat-associated protein
LRGQAELNRVGSRCTGKERDTESGNDYFGARYYSSAMGRFMSPDWSAKEEPVPYAKLDNPQSLNLYAYVLNDPLSREDPDGHSSLRYDGKTHTLTLYDKNGKAVGSWHANNRVDSHATLHGLPNGQYPFADTTRATHHSGEDKHHVPVESNEGEYGQSGILHLKGFNADGSHHDGVGVHSGREDVPDATAQHAVGPDHVTQGCLRTTDAAMTQITDTAKTDPLTNLTVDNNRPPQPQQPPPPHPQEKQQ